MTRDEYIAARKRNNGWQHPLMRLWSSAPRIECPHCHTDLLSDRYVLCSQHCEKCGQRVIEDDDKLTASEIEKLPTVLEFQIAQLPYRAALFMGVTIIIVAFIICVTLAKFHLSGILVWKGGMLLDLLYVGVFAMPVMLVVYVYSLLTTASSKIQIRCGHCKVFNLLYNGGLISSRRCEYCGRRQLREDPEAPAPSVSLPTLDESVKRARQSRKIMVRWCCIMLGLYLVAVVMMNTIPIPGAPAFLRSQLYVSLLLFGVLVAAIELVPRLCGWRFPFCCPHCQKRCKHTGLVIASQHCEHCGEQMIAEPAAIGDTR